MQQLHGFLPAPALAKVASLLLSGADSQTGLLSLVALAGVDTHTRSVVRRLNAEDILVFDALETCSQKTLGRPMLDREVSFSKASADSKAGFFLAAARLFVGYGETAFAGQGVTDLLQLEVARKVQHRLRGVRIQGCPAVTDSGINTLLLLCPNLERLQLEKLPLSLRIVDVGLGAAHSQLLFASLPNLRWLSLDGGPENMHAAVAACRKLKEVHYTPMPRGEGVDEALAALSNAECLKVLELHPQGAIMSAAQLRRAGQLPLNELRLESQAFRTTPTITQASPSHIDDRGIRALVDSICRRWRMDQPYEPFKLSLRGATAITHDAVTSLLRLPMLSELRIDGCPKIQALDKMRLIAKVKAGREMLENEEKRRLCMSGNSRAFNSGSSFSQR